MRPSLPENLRDVERVLEAHGYVFVRQRASHRHYRHAVTHRVLTFTINSGHKLGREHADNLMRRLRREQEGSEL